MSDVHSRDELLLRSNAARLDDQSESQEHAVLTQKTGHEQGTAAGIGPARFQVEK